MPYLVDTDVLIDVSRNNDDAVKFLENLDDWSISIVTALELLVGARNKDELSQIDQLLARYVPIPLTAEIGQLSYSLVQEVFVIARTKSF